MSELAEALTAAQKTGVVAWFGVVTLAVLVNSFFVIRWLTRASQAKKNGNGTYGRRVTDGNPASSTFHTDVILSRCAEHASGLADIRKEIITLRTETDNDCEAIRTEQVKQGKKIAVLWERIKGGLTHGSESTEGD